MSDHSWRVPTPPASDQLQRWSREYGLPQLGLRILAERGLLKSGLASDWDQSDGGFADPFHIPDAERAAQRLCRAIDAGERIIVHGDYDADGISGTALLTHGLRRLGAEVEPFVPDRIRDGYGVALRLVERAGEAGVRVLITVDTGSSAFEALERAAELRIDVVVCDHHLLEAEPARAYALLNPQRADSVYPHRDLCGCAVAWKLLCAVHALRGLAEPRADLDLVALATVADQVPLRGENRSLVRAGIEQLQREPRPGLAALLAVCRLQGVDFDEGDLAFQLAPRINAAGRIERAKTALDLLLAEDGGEARRLAARVDDLNRERKSVQQRVSSAAEVLAQRRAATGAPSAMVLGDAAWHFGVVGISAAHIATRFDVPAVLLAIAGKVARGSARSAAGIDLKKALDGCSDLLLRYGGHAAAAGLLIESSRIDDFRQRFEEVVGGMDRPAVDPGPRIDAVANLVDLDLELIEFLRRLGPFGAGSPRPKFLSRDLSVVSNRRVGTDHLRLQLRQAGEVRNFIGFSVAGEWASKMRNASTVDVIYSVGYREGTPFDPWQLQLHGLRESLPQRAVGATT